jgi:hypothetical protein
LRITGYRLRNSNLYGIDAILDCYDLNIFQEISFIIDTGSDNTIINVVDMIFLGINYDRLTLAERDIIGIEGKSEVMQSFHFPKSTLTFIDQDSKENIVEGLDEGYAIRNKEVYPRIREALKRTRSISLDANPFPSLLGMDILKKYKLTFNDQSAILE